MFIGLLAHAYEVHETTSESIWHFLEVWYIALIFFVVGLYVASSLTYILTKRSLGKTLAILLGILLIVSLFSYEISPVISVLSMLCGFMIALGMTLATLLISTPKK